MRIASSYKPDLAFGLRIVRLSSLVYNQPAASVESGEIDGLPKIYSSSQSGTAVESQFFSQGRALH